MSIVLAVTTFPDRARAESAMRTLVEERLIACGNIAPGVRSIYRWQGAVEEADEVLCFMKTTRAEVPALKARLPALHPYEVPELVVLPIEDGHQPYLAWVVASTGAGRS
jgi:periplasmic divalent cation tolerance protein